MMIQCWEMAVEDRPTFSEISLTISKFIEHIAGYLQMGYNPFKRGVGKDDENKEEDEKEQEEEKEEESVMD